MDKLPPSSSSQRLPSSSHRLPTISASEALQSIQATGPRTVLSGLSQLDNLLADPQARTGTACVGIFEHGKVAELWGPPGSGKTALAMRAAVEALKSGDSVAWIDSGSSLVRSRFQDMFVAANEQRFRSDGLDNLHCYSTPTVAHLLALTMHCPAAFPPPRTSLMVIDGLHSIFDVSYPRYGQNSSTNRTEATRWAASRRYSVLGSLMSAFKKLAVLNDMAIIVTTGCATRVRPGSGLGAMLAPGLGGAEWENGIANRLVIFRDFPFKQDRTQGDCNDSTPCMRFVGLQKLNGTNFGEDGSIGHIIPFIIDKNGPREMGQTPVGSEAATVTLAASSPFKSRKRSYHEIADSDEEDAGSEYGWADEDGEGLIDAAALNEEDLHTVEILHGAN